MAAQGDRPLPGDREQLPDLPRARPRPVPPGVQPERHRSGQRSPRLLRTPRHGAPREPLSARRAVQRGRLLLRPGRVHQRHRLLREGGQLPRLPRVRPVPLQTGLVLLQPSGLRARLRELPVGHSLHRRAGSRGQSRSAAPQGRGRGRPRARLLPRRRTDEGPSVLQEGLSRGLPGARSPAGRAVHRPGQVLRVEQAAPDDHPRGSGLAPNPDLPAPHRLQRRKARRQGADGQGSRPPHRPVQEARGDGSGRLPRRGAQEARRAASRHVDEPPRRVRALRERGVPRPGAAPLRRLRRDLPRGLRRLRHAAQLRNPPVPAEEVRRGRRSVREGHRHEPGRRAHAGLRVHGTAVLLPAHHGERGRRQGLRRDGSRDEGDPRVAGQDGQRLRPLRGHRGEGREAGRGRRGRLAPAAGRGQVRRREDPVRLQPLQAGRPALQGYHPQPQRPQERAGRGSAAAVLLPPDPGYPEPEQVGGDPVRDAEPGDR